MTNFIRAHAVILLLFYLVQIRDDQDIISQQLIQNLETIYQINLFFNCLYNLVGSRKALYINHTTYKHKSYKYYFKIHMENTIKYWCYNCEKHFQTTQQTASCNACHSQAIQIANQTQTSQDPSAFSVYQIQNPQQQNQAPPQPQIPAVNMLFPPLFNPFNFNFLAPPSQLMARNSLPPNIVQMSFSVNNISGIFNNIEHMFHQSDGLLHLLNSIMGQRGLTPATQPEVQKLQQVGKVGDCTICQEMEEEQSQDRKGYKLSCGHCFHVDCLSPWLQRTNTCPTCRSHI